jgi:integrase/recombinase XerC
LRSLAQQSPDLAALDRAAFLSWLGTLRLAPASRRSYLSSARVFLAWCVSEGHLGEDPSIGVAKVREPRREPRALPGRAVRALFDVLPDTRARAIVALMVGCGLRCCEVARLQMADWDRDEGTIEVRGKADNERILPLPGEVESMLELYLADRGAQGGPLILSQRDPGLGLSPTALSKLVSKWMAAAGVKRQNYDGRSAHALRHTCASDVFEGSRDLRAVQEMLGHQNLATTAIYLRRADLRRLRVAMEGRRYAVSA